MRGSTKYTQTPRLQTHIFQFFFLFILLQKPRNDLYDERMRNQRFTPSPSEDRNKTGLPTAAFFHSLEQLMSLGALVFSA